MSREKYPSRKKSKLGHKDVISGILSVNTRGVGYLKNLDKNKADIEIQNDNLNYALNGDKVSVILLPKKNKDRISGKVVSVDKRAKRVFVGVLIKRKKQFFLSPDDKKMYVDIIIPENSVTNKKATIRQKIIVKIIDWISDGGPTGEIIKIIGQAGEHNTEMESILYEKGFEIDFPELVEVEARTLEKIEKPIPMAEILKRRDFRKITTFTIDPKDAKDFDDAISIKQLENGNYEIGVHIADVSYYVREKTAIDTEAVKREFSVYLVDRTIPMLPETLSNDICSLNPNEDKLTFSAVFELTNQGKIISRWFGKTVIRSDKRFSYEEAQNILDTKSGDFFPELNILNQIATELRKEKMINGAIDFEQDDISFELDSQGKPIRIYRKARLATHKLVEEYMLLANKEVAEFIYRAYKKSNSDSPFIYRIHDLPDREKIDALGIFVKALGYDLQLKKDKNLQASDLQNLFQQIEGKAEESIIKTAAVRSMAKAIYSTQNIGHFGLAFEFYTHFTSPIRRYPDLLVHRLLEKHLRNEKLPKSEWLKYEKISADATEKEIRATEAERDSKKYKQAEFMQDKIGQVFDGIITGVTEWGVYIEEVNTRAEGMIKMRDLGNDYFSLDSKNYCIIGQTSKKKYSLGDNVKFKISSVNLERKSIDCLFV